MIKKMMVLFVFVLIKLSCFAEYTPEVKKILKEVKKASYADTATLFEVGNKALSLIRNSNNKNAEAEVYIYIGNYFYYSRNMSRSKMYFNKAIAEAKKYHDEHLEIFAKIRLTFVEYEEGNKEDSEKELLSLLEYCKKNKDYKNTVELLNLTGIIKEEKNLAQEAAKNYLEGINISETHNIEEYPSIFRNNLGLIKLYSGSTDEALKDFEKALILAKKEENQRLVDHIRINECVAWIDKKEFDKAIHLFQDEVIRDMRKNNGPRELSSAYINLGSCFIDVNRPDIALSYLDSATTLLEKHHIYIELTKGYLVKADVCLALNKKKEVNELLLKIRDLVDKTGNLDDKESYYYMKYKFEKSNKNFEAALENYLQHIHVRDTINELRNSKIIQEMQLKYNVQKKEVELEKEKSKTILLEKSNQEERFLKWFSIGTAFVVLVFIISILTLRYSRQLREKQAQFSRQLIEKLEEERLRISKDLHDDIGQSLSIVKSRIARRKNNEAITDQALEDEVGRIIEQTREISHNLYPSYLEKIGFVRSIARLLEKLQTATNIQCSFDISEKIEDLHLSTKTHLYRIVQECTNNTVKHAEASALKISIVEKNNEFILMYQDNGKGIMTEKQSGMGILSIKERANIIQASVDLDEKKTKGFKLTLKFRIKNNELKS